MSDYDTNAELPRAAAERGGVSPAAHAAMLAYYESFGGDIFAWAGKMWQESVSPWLDEFGKAIADRRHAIPDRYFETRMIWQQGEEGNPIFSFLCGKAIHSFLYQLRNASQDEILKMRRELLQPYVDKTSAVLSALRRRFPNCAAVVKCQSDFQSVIDAVMSQIVGGDDGCGFHQRTNSMMESFRQIPLEINQELPKPRRSHRKYCDLPNKRLAEMFGVSVKTIVRWKDEDTKTEDAQAFRLSRENINAMEEAARIYRQRHRKNMPRAGGRVAFNDALDYEQRRVDR